MIAYLTKYDASEGFNQIIDFLNESSIKYALTVNPNIYVSCIKQFWTSAAVKKVNDVTRLQALVDKKKVVITKASIRDALRLDDAEGIECLPNEEIFVEQEWAVRSHPPSLLFTRHFSQASRKFNFSKYIFDSLVRNVDSPTKFYMYQVGDLSSHSTKYTSPALTQKVFANMRRLGKGFFGVETPLFEGMIVEQPVAEGADEVHDEGVPAAGIVVEGDVSAANDEVPTADDEPSIPSPTPPTPPPQSSQDVPLTSQVYLTPPQLPQDKIAQALEITKLKSRVKKLERKNKVSKLKILKKVGSALRIDTSYDTVMDDDVVDDAKDGQDADIDESVDIQGRTADTTITAASDTITAASTTITAVDVPIPAATAVVAPTLTAAPSRRRKGVVIRDPQETTTTSIIIHSEAKSKDKGKWILDEVIDHVQRKQKEDKAVKRYQALKRKPQTEAQSRKNIMLYLKNVVGFKMDYFKGMIYDDIRLIFEKHFDSNVAFLLKIKEQMDEEDSKALKRLNESKEEKAAKKQKLYEEVGELKRHLQIVPNEEDDVYTEATPLARKVPVVDYEIYNENNKPYYKIKRADDIHAQIWKNQRSVHGQAKVKSWKLLESYGVQIITFTTTQLILLVERRYPLIRFTLDQMLNNVRLEVEEESEVSLELLSFRVDAAMDFKENHAKCLMLLVKDLVLSS
uniref:Xylulose kinase-1 n=1 Tax=Tanacetum cinerariifolium TaxID=118510 RepID=A0A6L2JN11_TANCI|nr:xylulose kinase-1 [Tanacetum cinerariifolium]